MKHISFKIICLIIWACITVFSVSGQNRTQNWETNVLESFNGDDGAPYTWKTQASRFISVVRDKSGQPVQDASGNSQRYPLVTYVEAYPQNAFPRRTADAATLRSLGLRGAFDRKGYNWIDLYPVKSDDPDGGPAEIPIPGIVDDIDCWVWGSNLRYYIEIYLRDYRGVVHTIRFGDNIAYEGWRSLRIVVPKHIPQERRILPSYAGLTFVKFRIWTTPTENVDSFYIYFKQLRVLTNNFNRLFDGNDLAEPDNVERLWNN